MLVLESIPIFVIIFFMKIGKFKLKHEMILKVIIIVSSALLILSSLLTPFLFLR